MFPFDLAGLGKRLEEINRTIEAEGFWDDHETAHARLEKACKAEVTNMKDIVAEMVPTYHRKTEE